MKDEENKEPKIYGEECAKMKGVEEKLKELDIPELLDFYEFYAITLLILSRQYTQAKQVLESSSGDLEELLFLKAFVYEKLQIFTSHKICFDMLSLEYQNKYKLLVSEDPNSEKVKEQFKQIKEVYELQDIDLNNSKKIIWKELLLKAGDILKCSLCEYVASNKSTYTECESFTELVQGKRSLEDCLLALGHLIRVWLLIPDNSIVFYKQAAIINPYNSAPYFFLGIVYRGKGDHKKAIEMYRKALAIRPEFPDCLFNMGNIFLEGYEDLAKAKECYTMALTHLRKEDELDYYGTKSIIGKGRIMNLLGEIEKRKSNIKDAVDCYIDGIREDYGFIDNYGDLADAIKSYKIEELAAIVGCMGKVIVSEESKLDVEEVTALFQSTQMLNLNLKRKVYESNIELLDKIFDMGNYLMSNVTFNEYQTNTLRSILKQMRTTK